MRRSSWTVPWSLPVSSQSPVPSLITIHDCCLVVQTHYTVSGVDTVERIREDGGDLHLTLSDQEEGESRDGCQGNLLPPPPP